MIELLFACWDLEMVGYGKRAEYGWVPQTHPHLASLVEHAIRLVPVRAATDLTLGFETPCESSYV